MSAATPEQHRARASTELKSGLESILGMAGCWVLAGLSNGWCDGIWAIAGVVFMLKAVAHAQRSCWHSNRWMP